MAHVYSLVVLVTLLYLVRPQELTWDTLRQKCREYAVKCAKKHLYLRCESVQNGSSDCNIGRFCSVREIEYLVSVACDGETILTRMASGISFSCARRMEAQACGVGIVDYTIFDYGNEKKRSKLCKKLEDPYTENCLAYVNNYRRLDCTLEEYDHMVSVVCSAHSVSQQSLWKVTFLLFLIWPFVYEQ